MTPAEARATIESVLSANLSSTLPLTFENDLRSTPATVWGRITLLHTDADLRSWTGPVCHWESVGRVIVQVFVPPGQGIKPAYDRLPTIIATLEGKKFGSNRLRLGAAAVRDIGTDDTGWWSVQVSFPFAYDHDSTP